MREYLAMEVEGVGERQGRFTHESLKNLEQSEE